MTLDQAQIVESPLLRTKITIPPLPPDFVSRPRLTEQIERGVRGPLTLLCAPAGYGKTNLLVEWARGTKYRVVWLTFDSSDNIQGRPFRYLIGALQTLEPHLGEEALDFLESIIGSGAITGSAVEIGLTQLINEISALPKEMVLVVDDFQALEGQAIHQSASFLLKNLPGNLHVVIASRVEPALDLAFLRGKGRVTDLGAADLRFTDEEIGLFFQQTMGLRLPAETIHALEQRTVGWVTALQMAALSIRNHPEPGKLLANLKGDVRYLVDFLAEEVLDHQPEEIRQFLLKSSILDTLTGPLCEAVVNPDAQPGYGTVLLNRLEHARLFIATLDEQHELFRYHTLFADFLRHIHTEINPAEIPMLHQRAALWFEQHGNLEEAFQHALASGDIEWAANLIQRNFNTLFKTGEVFSLTHWIGQLPDPVIYQRPTLGIAYAWGLIASYRLDLARYWLDDVRRRLSELEKQPDTASQISETETGLWNIRGGLAMCQSTLALLSGDMEQSAEFSRQATQYLREENPFIQSMIALDESLYFILSGDTVKATESLRSTARFARKANNLLVMILATCQLADVQALQGKLSQSWATLQKAQLMAVGPNGEPLPLAGLVDIGMGEILLDRYLIKEASTYLERGMKAAGTMWMLSDLDGLISLARLRQIQGDTAGSQAVIEEAMRLALSNESGQWDVTFVSAMAVRLALQRGDLPDAEQWWNRSAFPDLLASIPLEDYPYHIYEYLVITQARFLIALGRSQGKERYIQRCVELLDSLFQEASRFQRVASVIEIQVLQAVAQYSLGEILLAIKTLRSALALSEPEGFRRVYLYGGLPLAEILARCQSEPQDSDSLLPSSAFMESLQTALQGETQSETLPLPTSRITGESFASKTEDGMPFTLSAREVEVLKLIAEGKSNQEISAALYLAINTVKRHAYNIYAKLGVEKRTQAVSIARKLGLIT
ncbi:MAG TPA: LuxR C-terminal-related transcriptional regulator [Anaerolineaceae bacterium]|nr:LuxR C-terminal-related transcriptional regulator [Anaerolineaceae bacterium]